MAAGLNSMPTEMSPQKIIARNFPGPEHDRASFLSRLHEDQIWDVDEYWKLEYALYQLISVSPRSHDTTWHIFRIFSYTFQLLTSHFDAGDGFRIARLSDDEIYELRDRMQLVFEGYFSGIMPDQSLFEVRNPLLAAAASSS